MTTSLKEAGFDYQNPEHGIIVCGDIFDRGSQPLEVYEFLRNLPKERRILIRGNHEYLLRELIKRGFEYTYDYSNGTANTLCYIAQIITDKQFNQEQSELLYLSYLDAPNEVLKANYNIEVEKRNYKKFNNTKLKEILDWIFSDEWLNFYETNKYIFVHSFIPLISKEQSTTILEYYPEWRKATIKD